MVTRRWWLVGALIVCLAGCIDLLPWAVLQCAYVDGEAEFSASRLDRIGRALRAYSEDHGRLPPATVTDKEGRPLYSWRVLLLPYLVSEMDQPFKLDEPWDSPHNQRLLKETPICYRQTAPGDSPGLTRFKAFVGPGTAFKRAGVKWADLAKSILVVEAGSPVPWSKPADLVYNPRGPLPALEGTFQRPAFFHCFYLGQEQGFLALFGDNSVRFLRSDTDELTLRGFISRNGDPKVEAKPE